MKNRRLRRKKTAVAAAVDDPEIKEKELKEKKEKERRESAMKLFALLPNEAKVDPESFEGCTYTLGDPKEHATSTIGVILNKGTYYVNKVEAIPPNRDGMIFEKLNINKQNGVQIKIGTAPAASFAMAKVVAKWE